MKKLSTHKILFYLLLLVGGCQQCLVESDPEPVIGFNPKAVTATNESIVSLDIKIENLSTGIFGFTFQVEFDTSKLEIENCFKSVSNHAFFGESYLGLMVDTSNVLYGSFVKQSGQDLAVGSGFVGTCILRTKAPGTARLNFNPERFYFIDDAGVEIPHQYLSEFSDIESVDSTVIQFEIIDGRVDIDHPNINNP